MQVCSQCARVNPPEASYCYHDGALLAGHARVGPISGAQPFPSNFVFPSGQVCRNFDQLAFACQQNWQAALDLLRQGFLASFFGGVGRADLALAAQEAARFPDQDRGLDQLLAKLPTQVLQAPKVQAEPSEIYLGQLAMGTDRATELHLSNLGSRLLYGSVVSDCKWLLIGDMPGSSQKLFQFGAETTLPVHIRGKELRAGNKPLEGHLTIESNGGACVVTVKADVPILPFAEGVLAGALTPRQIAEKAKANPKEAAPLFEKGVVAAWFSKNGWTYPVQGPNAYGLGAVQQFFEALGLAKAPKVVVKTTALTLKGDGGQSLQAAIEVASPEQKPVFAYALCDQAWVDVSKVKLSRNRATITVAIPSVPNRPGETLEARITVVGNGNQRFKVPLSLTVGAPSPYADLAPTAVMPPPLPSAMPMPFAAATMEMPPLADMISGTPGVLPPPLPMAQIISPTPPPILLSPAGGDDAAAPRSKRRKPMWVHLLPLGGLALVLLVILLRDLIGSATGDDSADIDKVPRLAVFFDWGKDSKANPLGNTMNFGLVEPDLIDKKKYKQLTFNTRGKTNQITALINGNLREFGRSVTGKWESLPRAQGKGMVATWRFDELIDVTQRVEIITGEPVEVSPDVYKRLYDTCLIRYTLENRDNKPHQVAFRFLLDTYIGMNDGVPFTLPGTSSLISTFKDFANPNDIPDFIQAQENSDLKDHGTIAQLNLRPDVKKMEPPGRVSLTKMPDRNFQRWDVPIENFGEDSVIVLYWMPQALAPGQKREIGFTYGLGSVSVKGDRLGLTYTGNTTLGGELTIVALVAGAQPNQTVTLDLPPALQLLPGFEATQKLEPGQVGAGGKVRHSPATWRVRSTADGNFSITVQTSDGLSQSRRLSIKKSSIF